MWCIYAEQMVSISLFLFKLLRKHHLTKMAAMTLEIGSRSSIFELNLALHVVHLCWKDGVHISFCVQVIAQTSLFKLLRKRHLTKMATMTFEIGSRSPIFELNLALHVGHRPLNNSPIELHYKHSKYISPYSLIKNYI